MTAPNFDRALAVPRAMARLTVLAAVLPKVGEVPALQHVYGQPVGVTADRKDRLAQDILMVLQEAAP